MPVPRKDQPIATRAGLVDTVAWYLFFQALPYRHRVDNEVYVFGGQRLAWAVSAPTTGTWAQGDVVWHKAASVGQPRGWMCTAAGTPGTWTSMGDL